MQEGVSHVLYMYRDVDIDYIDIDIEFVYIYMCIYYIWRLTAMQVLRTGKKNAGAWAVQKIATYDLL